MIEVDHITKQYGSLVAVRDLTFRVEKGEVVGFLGPNGAGKTTTMRILTCYQPATMGTARVAGFDVFDEPMEVKRRIGYLPEHPPVYSDMYVRSYLDFVAQIKGVPKKDRRSRVDSAMERCGITDRAKQLIGQLSKGYRQRVGIAQAILHDPDVIILDEPTIGLDPNQIQEIRRLIRGLGREHTVILSTHILPEVEMTCDRVIIINRGRIAAVDTPQNLTARASGNRRYYVAVSGDLDAAADAIGDVPGVVGVGHASEDRALEVDVSGDSDMRPAIAARLVERDLGLVELRPITARLEDIFHELTMSDEESP
ncbi:MAG: ATP-binding cassette domain-containing protein [Gemmatimonadota bacterium]|nr:ATP-binding cassette domain-containing protein [Gemmatimonadota bacterium]